MSESVSTLNMSFTLKKYLLKRTQKKQRQQQKCRTFVIFSSYVDFFWFVSPFVSILLRLSYCFTITVFFRIATERKKPLTQRTIYTQRTRAAAYRCKILLTSQKNSAKLLCSCIKVHSLHSQTYICMCMHTYKYPFKDPYVQTIFEMKTNKVKSQKYHEE